MPIQNTDDVVEAQKGKARAVIYFQRDHADVAKQLAGALRAQNKVANLTFAANFEGPIDCESCQAIAIQATAPKVHLITKSYQEHMPHVEIHYFDKDGQACEGPQIEDTNRFVMPSLNTPSAEPVDPAPVDEAEIAATKAALTAEATGDPDEKATADPVPEHGNSDPVGETDATDPAETEVADDPELEAGDEGGNEATKS